MSTPLVYYVLTIVLLSTGAYEYTPSILCSYYCTVKLKHRCLTTRPLCCVSPASLQAMEEWMTVIDAAIQGVPEQAQRRRQTISHQFNLRNSRRVCYTHTHISPPPPPPPKHTHTLNLCSLHTDAWKSSSYYEQHQLPR